MKDRFLNLEERDIYAGGLVSSGPVALWHLKVKLQWKLWLHWSQFLTGGQKMKVALFLYLWSAANILTNGDVEGHPVSRKSIHILPDFPLLPWCRQTLMQTNLLPWCLSQGRACSSLLSTWPSFLHIIWIIKYRSMSCTCHPSLMKLQIHVPGFMVLKSIQKSIKRCPFRNYYIKLHLKLQRNCKFPPLNTVFMLWPVGISFWKHCIL